MSTFTDLKAIRYITGTKISHDYEGTDVNTFSYKELIRLNSPAIGIPCRENRLVVIDVDVAGEAHKDDGREFWANFCVEYGIPRTYTVQTRSNGFHFYFELPDTLNLDTFRPPAKLAPGVDVKFRGWVAAPPSPGYVILEGNITTIQEAPPSLLAYMTNTDNRGDGAGNAVTFDNPALGISFSAHKPFSDHQILELRSKIKWLQSNGTLDRTEWRDGLFSLKAGTEDPIVLDELVDMWTVNKGYIEGDEIEAREIIARADKYGPIGPGTIFSIIKAVSKREGASELSTPYTIEEIINRSRVQYSFAKDGALKIETSETNASALMGATHDIDQLYWDARSDLYIYKGRQHSDTELVNILMPMLQSSHAGLGLSKFRRAQIAAGLEILMSDRKVDPHAKFLSELVWDGVPRIEQFFQTYVGLSDSPYHRKVSKNFWVALAARGLKPGCKFDSVIIIEGREGIRKSSLVEAIAGEYTFAPARRDSLENLDELRKMHQSVIVELPELMGLVGESPEKVKAFLASPFDIIRELYARRATKKQRGFIFVGTTNSSTYLSGSMGLRRFWPVKIPDHVATIDIEGVKRDRAQLFAEAIQYFKDGYEFYDMPTEFLETQVSARVTLDPLTEAMGDLLRDRTTTSPSEVYRLLEASGYVGKGFTVAIRKRINSVLSYEGFTQPDTGSNTWSRGVPLPANNTFHGFDLNQLV